MSKKEKKVLKAKIVEKLATTFSGLDAELSPKKFKRNIRKASKALLAGVNPAPAKKKKTASKKTTKKEVADSVPAA